MKTVKRRGSFVGLYTEGLRQTRKMTLIFSILGAIAAFLPLTFYAMNLSPDANVVKVIAAGEQLSFLVLSFMAAAPLMTLSLFSYLNKRASSDFFHSLPCTRAELFLSQVAALVTQFAVVLCSCGGAFLLALLFNRRYFVLLPGSLAALLGGCFAGMLLVSAAILIAMGLTGTLFSNVVFSGFIIFAPRVLIYFFTYYLSRILPMTVRDSMFALANLRLNIPVASTLYISSPESILTSVGSMLYTFVLALVYFAAAFFIFKRRKSEAAGSSAPSRRMQTVYRIVLGFASSAVFTLSLSALIIQENSGYYQRLNYDVISLLLGYLFSAAVFFGYEIITTRSWKNLPRAFPSLGIVVALNVLLGLLFAGVCSFEAGWAPSAERVKAVYVVSERSPDNYRYLSLSDIASFESENIPLTDPELCRAVSEALARDVKDFENGTYYKTPQLSFDSKLQYMEDDYAYSEMRTVSLRIETGFGSKVRLIRTDDGLEAMLSEKTRVSEAFRERFTDVPEMLRGSGDIYYESNSMRWNLTFGGDGSERVGEIWEILREEAKGLSVEEMYRLSGEYGVEKNAGFWLTGQAAYRFCALRVDVRVDKELTPRAYEAAKKMLRSIQENEQKPLADALVQFMKGPEKGFEGSVSIRINTEDGEFHNYWELDKDAEELSAALRELCPSPTMWEGEDDALIVYVSLKVPGSGRRVQGELFLSSAGIDDELIGRFLEKDR